MDNGKTGELSHKALVSSYNGKLGQKCLVKLWQIIMQFLFFIRAESRAAVYIHIHIHTVVLYMHILFCNFYKMLEVFLVCDQLLLCSRCWLAT